MRRGRESVFIHEGGMNVMEEVRPYFTDVMRFVQRGNRRISEGVGLWINRERVVSVTKATVRGVCSGDIVLDICGGLLDPATVPRRRQKRIP